MYAKIKNLRSSVSGAQELVSTVSILPPRVNMYEAFSQVRQELKVLEQGVQMYDVVTNMVVTARVALCGLPADLLQRLKNVNHLGLVR